MKLVNDKIPDLMRAEGMHPLVRPVQNDKEFFQLLKEKILNDINKVSMTTVLERKIDFLIDAHDGLGHWLDGASRLAGKDLEELTSERMNKVGSLWNKTVLLEENGDNSEMIKTITAYGELSNWPRLVIGRNNEGKAYSTMVSGGKEAYEKMMRGENLQKLYEAVKKNDKYEEEGT